jgi:hypothetical protein
MKGVVIMSETVSFSNISQKFDVNISSLRVFNNQIGKLAEEHDKNTIAQKIEDFAEFVGVSSEELQLLDGVSKEDFQAIAYNNELVNIDNTNGIGESSRITIEQKAIIHKIASIAEPEFPLKFIQYINKSKKLVPIQAYILRRSALITLASHFEYLISELIHSFYSLYPQALSSDERVLSLSDLREIGSIEEAENELISREIDALLRDNLEKQFEYLSRRLKVNLDALTNYKDVLVEIFQRRNVFVHNDGIANKIYMARVAPDVLESGMKDGKKLDVTNEYLNKALDTVYISGVMLIQLCWRKWQKNSSEEADSVYISLIYEELLDKDYSCIKNLQNFSTGLKYETDRTKRVLVVNHAIALRELNEIEEMEDIINTLDWSSCSLEFRTALLALRKEESKLLDILPKAIAAKEIDRFALEQWPLFTPFHRSPGYIALLESCPEEISLSD